MFVIELFRKYLNQILFADMFHNVNQERDDFISTVWNYGK